MKNILLLVHDDAAQEARLQAALDVAKALDGHLDCLQVMDLPIIIPDYYGSGAEAEVISEARTRAAKIRERLEQRLASEGIAWTFGETFGNSVDALEQASLLADLIVMSARTNGSGKHSHPERLPLKADRPLLAVPPLGRGLNTAGKALVAWDGSAPCIEAVRAAIPLLKCAEEVLLLEFNQLDGALAMTEIASYLSRHGVSTELLERQADGPVADAILSYAKRGHADYIVMGAYSMTHLAEAVFGGVTRSVLLHAEIPLFMAH